MLMANIWLWDISRFSEINEVWENWITPEIASARATLESELAGPQYKVEIALIAALPEQTR